MDSKGKLYNLERVERSINIYRNIEDPELIEEIAIAIPVNKLSKVIGAKDDDPLLYKAYVLDEKQLNQLNKEIGTVIKPDFNLYYYVLECHGIYNW